MVVKVMVAPAIANAAIEKRAPARPRRRRSSVYDADGNEVFITLMCLKCHKMRPLSQFGLRKMADGAIRNQPWCRTCRSGAGAERSAAPKGSAETGGSPVLEAPVAVPGSAREEPSSVQRPSSTVAAEVAAALAGGMRR